MSQWIRRPSFLACDTAGRRRNLLVRRPNVRHSMAIAACAAVIICPSAHAEYINAARTSGTALTVECGPLVSSTSAVSCGAGAGDFYSTYTGSASASAWGDAYGLHAVASTDLIGLTDARGPVTLIAGADVQLQDWLYFPSYAGYTYNVYGYVTMTAATDGLLTPGGNANTQLDLGGSTPGYECYFSGSGSCTADTLVNFTTGFSLYLLLNVGATAELDPSGVGYAAGSSSSASADFSNTSFISGLSFTDVNGNPLSLTYTTASGLTYPMAQRVNGVPEPTTPSLLAIALISILPVSYRRIR